MQAVEDVRSAIMPALERIGSAIQDRYPSVQVKSYGAPLGETVEGTPRGYIFAVDCLLPERQETEAGSIALIITFELFVKEPIIPGQQGSGLLAFDREVERDVRRLLTIGTCFSLAEGVHVTERACVKAASDAQSAV